MLRTKRQSRVGPAVRRLAGRPAVHGVEVGAVLTVNGRVFCGKPDSHPYELLLILIVVYHDNYRPVFARRFAQVQQNGAARHRVLEA